MTRPRPCLCSGSEREKARWPWNCSPDNNWWTPRTETYPASDLLRPGDILLFAPLQPTFIEKIIQQQQLRWDALPEHARFTHAAIYVGLDHLICESVPQGGVRYSTLDARLDHSCCVVRRWPGLTPEQGQRIAYRAVSHLGEPYGWGTILAQFLKLGSLLSEEAAEQMICSRLCDRAITRALIDHGFPVQQVSLHSKPGTFVTPAVLSLSPKLADVEVEWRRCVIC